MYKLNVSLMVNLDEHSLGTYLGNYDFNIGKKKDALKNKYLNY